MNTSPGLIAFDLDLTLIRVNSGYVFARYLIEQGDLPRHSLAYFLAYRLGFNLGILSVYDVHHRVFDRFFRGKSLLYLQEQTSRFLGAHFESYLYAPVVACLREAQRQGHKTAIISSSADFLVEAFAQYFQVDEWAASRYVADSTGCLSAVDAVMEGTDKARCVVEMASRLGIAPQAITAYSDSPHDLPFLEAAGRAIAVNPGRKLRRLCLKNQWEIMEE